LAAKGMKILYEALRLTNIPREPFSRENEIRITDYWVPCCLVPPSG
jgi:hypothetical protein